MKKEITQYVRYLNKVGCEIKIIYKQYEVQLEISGDHYFTGTLQQVLNLLYTIKKAIDNSNELVLTKFIKDFDLTSVKKLKKKLIKKLENKRNL